MTTIIYENTSLANPICCIVNKYVDNSISVIYQLFQLNGSNLLKTNHSRKDITLHDIFIIVTSKGYNGFYILLEHKYIINKIEELIVNENLSQFILKHDTLTVSLFWLKNTIGSFCSLSRINCWVNC